MLLFYLAPLYNIHGVEWKFFILLPLGALRGLVEFCADRASLAHCGSTENANETRRFVHDDPA